MAGIEIRAGQLSEARTLLEHALADEPSVSGFTMLALVERQVGEPAAALGHIKQGVQAPDALVALVDVAEAWTLAYEIARDAGEEAAARAALDAALTVALAGRTGRRTVPEVARAERLLAHVLYAYGDERGAVRAFERGLTTAAPDRSALGSTMLDAIGRALVRRDLSLARMALKRGIEGEVNDDDLVYGGLWVWLLERELHAAPDGSVERALRPGPHNPWPGRLCSWTSGKMSDTELAASAREATQRIEAEFYATMIKRSTGDPRANERLREIAKSPIIDLMEVQLARDMLAPAFHAALPHGITIP
jgi:tetratricopeptide (TPR) repeat protein